MKFLVLLLLAVTAKSELEGLLDAVPSALLSDLGGGGTDPKMLGVGDKTSSSMKAAPLKIPVKPVILPKFIPVPLKPMGSGKMLLGKGKLMKAAAVASIPVKAAVAKTAVAGKVLAAPKLKAAAVMPMKMALKKKPKVHKLKPIVYVIEKPVPVYHKVPVPKKVLVPKFYPVYKKIPVPKIIPVPFKVPVKKIIPKIVKIPKAIPIPKFVPVKKPVPIAIPYPVPKFYKVPVKKLVPYKKFIPIPIPKKVPKFIPFPVKKIIKVPKPYYVPVKVPHFSASYVKAPVSVNVPDLKKPKFGVGKLSGGKLPTEKFMGEESSEFKSYKNEDNFDRDSVPDMGKEDQELLKMLTGGGMAGNKNIKI